MWSPSPTKFPATIRRVIPRANKKIFWYPYNSWALPDPEKLLYSENRAFFSLQKHVKQVVRSRGYLV
jgi:hypothetical protein